MAKTTPIPSEEPSTPWLWRLEEVPIIFVRTNDGRFLCVKSCAGIGIFGEEYKKRPAFCKGDLVPCDHNGKILPPDQAAKSARGRLSRKEKKAAISQAVALIVSAYKSEGKFSKLEGICECLSESTKQLNLLIKQAPNKT